LAYTIAKVTAIGAAIAGAVAIFLPSFILRLSILTVYERNPTYPLDEGYQTPG